jgi:hypothetical protein
MLVVVFNEWFVLLGSEFLTVSSNDIVEGRKKRQSTCCVGCLRVIASHSTSSTRVLQVQAAAQCDYEQTYARLCHSPANDEIPATIAEMRHISEEDAEGTSVPPSPVPGLGVASSSGTGVPSDAPSQSMTQLPPERSLSWHSR